MKRKKHIALLISSLARGGSERVLVNLAEYFYSIGYQVTIVTQYQLEDEFTVSEGIHRILSEITPEEMGKGRISNFLARYAKLRRIWKQERPDLILSFIGKNNMMALLTSRLLKIPVVISVRGEPEEEYYSRTLRLAARLLFPLADGIVLQTKRSRSFFPASVQKKAVILKNSLNPAFLGKVYEGERKKQIVAVGRIDANKNHEMIIRAFAELADSWPDYELVIYGEGELRQRLNKLVEELGLEEQIHLPGSIVNVAEAIGQSAVFILSSYSEGMPNTLIEAMALGLAVISTDCPSGGPRELIQEGVNGLLIQPGNQQQLTEAINRLLTNPELARRMGRNAARLQKELNPDVVNQTWKEYLEKLMNG
ncbi:MAG: glycosyltransferase [Lachnospiraceae bacterium]|nr:glycosyltransferase [Lachnospiraceae bacterium]